MALPLDWELLVREDPRAVAEAAAARIREAARAAVRARGEFHLVLSGGSTPRPLHELLACEPRSLPWARTHILFGDERCVPPDHPASNYRSARETLLDRVPVRREAVHRIPGEREPEAAAREYEAVVRKRAPDVVLLGLGADGHTLSLFPGTPGLARETRLVIPTRAPVKPRDRVSLTLAAVRRSPLAIFLVTGEAKAEALARLREGRRDPARPASLVRPADGGTVLLVADAAAAGRTG